MQILKFGSTGTQVSQLQQELQRRGFHVQVSNTFDAETLSAVIAFQKANRLNADGIVGGITWRYLFGSEMPNIAITAPILQRDLDDLFGSPLESSFKSTYIKWIDLLEFGSMFHIANMISANECGFYGHYLLEKPLKAAFRNVLQAGLQHELRVFDGCHVVRNARGRSFLSTHAYGLALDFNAFENPYNCEKHLLSNALIACFAKAGFENGGLWEDPIDWMHFQICWSRDWREWEATEVELTPQVPTF